MAGERVELLFLEDVLLVRGGELVLTRDRWGSFGVAEPPAPYGDAPGVYCEALAGDDAEHLTESEYRARLATREDQHLFIDMLSAGQGGRHPAGRRNGREVFEETTLTPNEAAALAELVARRSPLRPTELQSVSVTHPDKVIEQGRRKVDVRLARYQWRAFHTIRGDTPDAKHYAFQPPDGFRCLIFRPHRP